MSAQALNQVYIGLGTNLGNRAANLKTAIDLLKANPQLNYIDQSSIYENPAIEEAGPEDFFNQVIVFETTMQPRELLNLLQEIETKLDPERADRGRKKSRFIDLDILTFGNENINEPDLIIPHPRMQERDFVMNPMNEVQTKLYKEKVLMKGEDHPAIKSLTEFSDFSRKLSNKEKQIIEEIDDYIKSKTDFVFRPMLLQDLDEVLVIDEEAFGKKHWGRDTFVRELSNQYAHYLTVADKAGKVLAFIGLWFVVDEMHIMTLAVDSSARRQGLAEALILLGLKHCYQNRIRTSTLEVKANNQAAIDLYDKYLFKKQGLRPKYYADGQAALLLWTEEINSDSFLDNLLDRLSNLSPAKAE